MATQPVEWVLVIYYGVSAHRATYGRLRKAKNNTKYTKDYIQLSRKDKFMETVSRLFPVAGGVGSVPLTYQWPTGTTAGAFVFQSSDRPHLKWETSLGAPKAWKMSLGPTDATSETIPGDPTHLDFAAAENEFAQLASRGAGQPYLLAIKLRDEANKLHLRAYLEDPTNDFAWADIELVPEEIRSLVAQTSQRSAIAWSTFQSGGVIPGAKVESVLLQLNEEANPSSVIAAVDEDTGRALASYLLQPGYGLFFDPTRNHDAWIQTAPLSAHMAASVNEVLAALTARFPAVLQGDAAAEMLDADPDDLQAYINQIDCGSFEVPDATATVKTRGSAQKAFALAVKGNYGMRCAVTGIETKEFLVAAHIVPWSIDQSIRLDPTNGICLSLLIDRAFEKGYLLIEDDHTIRIDWERVGDDSVLRNHLEPYNGTKLSAPANGGPRLEYIQRRRILISSMK